MKSTQTFSILFWINISRAKEDEAELYARILIFGILMRPILILNSWLKTYQKMVTVILYRK